MRAHKTQIETKSQSRRKTRSSSLGAEIQRNKTSDHTYVTAETEKPNTTISTELSDTVLNELDITMDRDDTLESTVSDSVLDDTYITTTTTDDSITELKQTESAQVDTLPKTNKEQSQPSNSKQQNTEDKNSDSEIKCTNTCSSTQESPSIRCNMCMVWYHTLCVSISDVDVVGAWTCADCRVLPETVNNMKSQIDILLQTTNTMMDFFKTFSENVDSKFQNLNDRITTVINQNKCYDESSTSSMSDIRQDICVMKTDIERKTGTIISKSQSIYDKVKYTSDLVTKINEGNIAQPSHINRNDKKQDQNSNAEAHPSEKQNQHKNVPKNKQDNQTRQSEPSTEPNSDTVITISDDDESDQSSKSQKNSAKQQTRNLTLITGSCIMKHVETRFLADNVRIKTFAQAKIETLKENITKMDLSRYEKIVLHIGGHDVDAKVGPTEFKHKYQSLLNSLADKNCKILISGLLPRRGTNMKPYNSILNDLSSQFKAQFIDNHDSFIMASGKLPFEYYQADRVNLKFPGTRLLVQNINDKCKIIPNVQRSNIHKRSKTVHYRQTRSRSFEH